MRMSRLVFSLVIAGLTLNSTPLFADGDPGDSASNPSGKVGSSASTQSVSSLPSGSGLGIDKATGPKLSRAMGHYARARSLLIAAIQEFDKGFAIANPNAILDSKAWRSDIIDRTRELERVLDPQPRVSNTGVRYDSDSRLLKDLK